MKILLSERVIELKNINPAVQVIHYSDQTFGELCETIKQLAIEPFDFAIVLNDNLANIIPFFDGTIVSDFFKKISGLKSISFYGDKYIFTNKYIEYFDLLQKDLAINVYYARKRDSMHTLLNAMQNKFIRPNMQQAPAFFSVPFTAPFTAPFASPFTAPFTAPFAVEPKHICSAQNGNLFDACNSGHHEDKKYFIEAIPNLCHKLKGNLTIDYTANYKTPILIDNGAIFDGCGHTITLENDVIMTEMEAFGGFV